MQKAIFQDPHSDTVGSEDENQRGELIPQIPSRTYGIEIRI
jgi:hypothetical protein